MSQDHEQDHEHTELEVALSTQLRAVQGRLHMVATSEYILRLALLKLLEIDQTVTVELPAERNILSNEDGSPMTSVTFVKINETTLDLKQ